jgi:bile acid:Na+ symporter, BASS family
MNMQDIFKIVVVIFTVSNLASMGLECKMHEAIKTLKSARFVVLTSVWGWVAGPALACLITRVIPLTESHAAGLLLISMAPAAPFYPLMVRKARGDMSFAAAFTLLATVGTVVLLPLMAPLMITGLTVNRWDLTKPLLTMVLLPLMIGIAIRDYAASAAARVFPVVKRIGDFFSLATLLFMLVLYGRDMIDAAGSYAIVAQILFLIGMALMSYRVGFGLKQEQRSVMSLGMCTRNIAAVFVAYLAIPNPDPGLFVMIALVVPLTVIISFIAARIFAARTCGAGVESAGNNP